jgi:Bacterial TSP3 repeat
MNKKLFLLLVVLTLLVAGCSISSVPYLNKVLPKQAVTTQETVTKVVFTQNGKIDGLVDFAKQADALAKEKWASDATLKTVRFSSTDSFMTYDAQFSSNLVKTKEGRPGDLTVFYNYASAGAEDSTLERIKIDSFSPRDNSTLTGLACVESDLCGNSSDISSGEQIDPNRLNIATAELDKCLSLNNSGMIVVTAQDNSAIPKGSVILQCGQFRLDAYSGQEIASGTASSTTPPNSALNNPATSTPTIATSTEKISTSSQAAIDLNKDSDNDGLPDWQELKYGTNPNNPDTDGDGYTDGAEVAAGYNPLGPGKMTAAQMEIKKEITASTSPAAVSKSPAATPVLIPATPATNEIAHDCTGVTSGTLKMDGGTDDKKLAYCFTKTMDNGCGNFELIFDETDLGKIKLTVGANGSMCELRIDFGDASQIKDESKKGYADKYIIYSTSLSNFAKNESTVSYENINTAQVYGMIDYFENGYKNSESGFSGNLDKTLISETSPVLKQSRDAIRVADIQQIQTVLELYYNDVGKYPDQIVFGGPLKDPAGKTTYINLIPENPLPNDGTCPADFVFQYQATTGDKASVNNYKLTYCLGAATQKNSKTIPAGINIATSAGMTGGK